MAYIDFWLDSVREQAPLVPFWTWFAGLICFAYIFSTVRLHVFGPKAHLIGASSKFEPRLIANARVFLSLRSVIDDGYHKFKHSPFWFARNDADMVVIPANQAEEIRSLTAETANPTEAHVHNLLGPHTQMDLILTSDLHSRVLQSRLTPNISKLFAPVQDELEFALSLEMPQCRDTWTEFRPYHTILELVARISARAFVGLPYCRSKVWLEITTQFTENVFKSLLIMRAFPTWTHALISPLLPTKRANSRYIKQAQALLFPEIARYQEFQKAGLNITDPPSLLGWMVDCAADKEADPKHLAHLEVVTSLASIHTTQMAAVHCLLDLAARPEYFEPLRQEILDTIESDGGWQKTSLTKLRKLDSFLKESQRFSPPSLLSNHRIVKQRHTLSDGTVLPPDSHICMAAHNIDTDPAIMPRADLFDGFRYEQMRRQPGCEHHHQFTTTTTESLHFGHGRYSCPGRFFAALEIKSILVRLIMNYDYRMTAGSKERPPNLFAYEFIFPDPDAILLVKERRRDLQTVFRVKN